MSGPGGTLLARAERARRVAEARARGEQWDAIAQREGVSRSTAKRLAAEFEQSGNGLVVLDGDRVNPTAAIQRALRAHLLALDAAEAAMSTATNESAKVGALGLLEVEEAQGRGARPPSGAGQGRSADSGGRTRCGPGGARLAGVTALRAEEVGRVSQGVRPDSANCYAGCC